MSPQRKRRQNRIKQVITYVKENRIIKAAKFFELNKEAEKELYDWIIEQRKQELGVTYAITQFPSGIIIWFQQNGWMDAQLMKEYIDYVKEHLKINNTPTIMVYDSFRGYLEESVKTKFRDKGIDLAVISNGLTSIYQLLNVTINKPFKDNLRKE
ncbi:pogo transposable element with KRAB domain [Rhizophagus clarus]|uniref:Pogo transposable element with KRAB domain n=2 Tax=Rhizophagus clarus TaxID=94130 RepID=A0A8H3LF65_9GLOM|nr:pogo transposable element with KRAB domain [Rhizophagus clarus]